MTAADLTAELKEAIRDVARGAYTAMPLGELIRALDVVIAAHRAECFANSPATDWLRQVGAFGTIELGWMHDAKCVTALARDPSGVVGCDSGGTVEQALAELMNGLSADGEKP